ncbi:MAG: pseudouridylate synthase [Bacteroidales bacterium]|jgi:predicted hotdog family 3-hydroxylacyl-ACP dehydratase|nr:pseudouridylate synthase [Bacteroidales bacterium]
MPTAKIIYEISDKNSYFCPNFEMMEEAIDVLKLIPQQPPFVMIDRLLHFSVTKVSAGLKVSSGNIFVDNGVLTEAGIIESIAQTCALRMGYIGVFLHHMEDAGIKIGFIGAINNLVIEKCPRVNDKIVITVTAVNEVLNFTFIDAQVTCEGAIVASCSMKISLSEINSQA